MCNKDCIRFVEWFVTADEVEDKLVIESGSRDVNGSVRPLIEALKPRIYIGTDIADGHRVDRICRAEDLVDTFGEESFDMLISTEMVEHVEDWRTIISNFKRILKPGGVLFITTRSKGFGYHGYPFDFWRYEVADMQVIFSDFEILKLVSDPFEPGVFIKARRPEKFVENDLSAYSLYSIVDEARRAI